MYIKCKSDIRVHNAETVAKVFYAVLKNEDEVDQKKEHFWAMGLTGRKRIIYLELISLGCLTESVVHPREVFKSAIIKSVYSLIVCHNHPSEEAKPSLADKNITDRLKVAGEILGIEILDHIIIGKDGYFSFVEEKIL